MYLLTTGKDLRPSKPICCVKYSYHTCPQGEVIFETFRLAPSFSGDWHWYSQLITRNEISSIPNSLLGNRKQCPWHNISLPTAGMLYQFWHKRQHAGLMKGRRAHTSVNPVKNFSRSSWRDRCSSDSSGESRDSDSRKRFSVALHRSLSFSLDSDRSSNWMASESE